MKKFISLHIQKIVLFIPFANYLIPFAWLFNYKHMEKQESLFAKSLLLAFGVSIPLIVVQILISRFLPDNKITLYVSNFIALYLMPFFIGYALIKYQAKAFEKAGSKNKKRQ